ncbi:MAG: hypothetical protein WKG00_13650 [Polyangiaceae bacterium]
MARADACLAPLLAVAPARGPEAPVAAQAAADRLEAGEARFAAGLEAERAKRWAEALRAFQAAGEVRTTAAVLFHVGLCHDCLGDAPATLTAFEAAWARAQGDGAADVVRAVPTHLARLRPQLGRVTARAIGGVGGQAVIDGRPVAADAVIAVPPGAHRAEIRAVGQAPVRRGPAAMSAQRHERLRPRPDGDHRRPRPAWRRRRGAAHRRRALRAGGAARCPCAADRRRAGHIRQACRGQLAAVRWRRACRAQSGGARGAHRARRCPRRRGGLVLSGGRSDAGIADHRARPGRLWVSRCRRGLRRGHHARDGNRQRRWRRRERRRDHGARQRRAGDRPHDRYRCRRRCRHRRHRWRRGGAGGGKPSCDADGDGHQAEGACGGDDCDDAAADAHPGQDAYFASPRSDGSFDWNCDGDAERETPIVACSGGLGCGLLEGDTGFEKEVECGDVAQLGSCGGIPCTFGASRDATQRCR